MRETRISMMRVRVNQTRNDFFPFGIDDRICGLRQHRRFSQGDHFSLMHRYVGFDNPPRSPNFSITNQQIQFLHSALFSLSVFWKSLSAGCSKRPRVSAREKSTNGGVLREYV